MDRDNNQRKTPWLWVSIASGILLAAAFILVMYSITALNDCLERSLSDASSWQGLCSLPGLRSATTFNWALILLILASAFGLVKGIVMTDRITKEQNAEEDEEPPVEMRAADAYLPSVSPGSSREKAEPKDK